MSYGCFRHAPHDAPFRDEAWQLVAFGAHRLVHCAMEDAASGVQFSSERTAALLAVLKVAFIIIDGARASGLEREASYANEIQVGEASLCTTATSLRSFHKDADVRHAAAALVKVIDPAGAIAAGAGHDDDDDNDVGAPPPLARLGVARQATMVADYAEDMVDLSKIDGERTSAQMLEYFVEALLHNPQIKLKWVWCCAVSCRDLSRASHCRQSPYTLLLSFVCTAFTCVRTHVHAHTPMSRLLKRRFMLMDVLENAEDVVKIGTTAGGCKDGGQFMVPVDWEMVVKRMVGYVLAHNYDADESHCIRVLGVLRMHLLKARSQADGEEMGLHDMAEDDLAAYVEKQETLDDLGVTQIVFTAIATHSAQVEGSVADEAIELLMELVHGGNAKVQSTIHTLICADKDQKFLSHLRARFKSSLETIRERKERVVNAFEPLTKAHIQAFDNAMQTCCLVERLCEGHNRELQDILRDQPMHQGNVNIIKEMLGNFTTQVDSNASLRRMENAEVRLLSASLDALVESIQGPCSQNQEFIVKDDSFLASLDTILQSPFHTRISRRLRMGVKMKSLEVLRSVLEGRPDRYVHAVIVENFEPAVFEIFQAYLFK